MSLPAGATPSPEAGRKADNIIGFSSKRPAVKMEKETDAESQNDAPSPTRRRGTESSPLDLSSGVRKRDRSSGGPAGPRQRNAARIRFRLVSAASMAGWKPGAFRDAAQELGFQELVRQPPGPTQALERMTELSRLSGESRAGGAGGGRQVLLSAFISSHEGASSSLPTQLECIVLLQGHSDTRFDAAPNSCTRLVRSLRKTKENLLSGYKNRNMNFQKTE